LPFNPVTLGTTFPQSSIQPLKYKLIQFGPSFWVYDKSNDKINSNDWHPYFLILKGEILVEDSKVFAVFVGNSISGIAISVDNKDDEVL